LQFMTATVEMRFLDCHRNLGLGICKQNIQLIGISFRHLVIAILPTAFTGTSSERDIVSEAGGGLILKYTRTLSHIRKSQNL